MATTQKKKKPRSDDPRVERALDNLRDSIESWASTDWGNDLEMRKAQAKDLYDLRKIRSLIRKGKTLEACIHAQDLDTLLKDQIPSCCWKLLKSAGE
jgi:predicted RNA binding protein with dsRBD fold (UPF0201 family)